MSVIKPKRRWFRFSIRDLLLVIAIAALVSGWWFDHKRLTDKIEQISPLVQRAATIDGRVVYGESGQPASGIRVIAQEHIRANPFEMFRRWRTDDDGHYKFVGLRQETGMSLSRRTVGRHLPSIAAIDRRTSD